MEILSFSIFFLRTYLNSAQTKQIGTNIVRGKGLGQYLMLKTEEFVKNKGQQYIFK